MTKTPLSKYLASGRQFLIPRGTTQAVHVRRAEERIRRRWPDVDVFDTSKCDAEQLALEMDHRREKNNWREFYWADAAYTASAFIDNELWKNKRFERLFDFLIEQVGSGGNRMYMRSLFHKYLETFSPAQTLTKRLAANFSTSGTWKEIDLPAKLVNAYKVFNVNAAPERIAEDMLENPSPFDTLLQNGIKAPHSPGLMERAHEKFLARLAPQIKLQNDAAIEAMLEWLNPRMRDSVLHGKGAADAVNTILLACRRQEPNTQIKEKIKSRLIAAYGDPRLERTGTWAMCSEEAKKVILKWITGETIAAFFEIISQCEQSHMWADRRDLWIDLYKNNRITEAWFALSRRGAQIARDLAERTEAPSLENFAENRSSSGQDREKCLLIMQISGRWVVEGSHNFKTHIFQPGDTSSVTPYEDTYTCEQFRHAARAERIWHYANWRNKVMEELF